MKKYFAWIDEQGYWKGQKLLPLNAISSLIAAVKNMPHFTSVQVYDTSDKFFFCPLYADFDSDDLRLSLSDVRFTVSLLESMGIEPEIYFSGSKGFHLIIRHQVKHPYAHYISRYFFESLALNLKTLDKKVYRSKALLRVINSPASTKGFYKIQISCDELFNLSPEGIKNLSKEPRPSFHVPFCVDKISRDFWDILERAEKHINNITSKYRDAINSSDKILEQELTPCLKSILISGCRNGTRNTAVFLLAKVMRQCNTDRTTALNIFLNSNPVWEEFETKERGVSRVISSVFASDKHYIGCKADTDGAFLMRKFCEKLCWYNSDRLDIRFTKEKNH